jgi:arylsulfatase A-like enzyme
VVFTSDNGGERFADTWPFTGQNARRRRIPAIVRWPRHIPAGATSEQVMISMDWMPTFLEAAGAHTYPPDGISLLPVLTGNAPGIARKLF